MPVDTDHCDQCLCGLEENPTFSVNNSKACRLQLPGNLAAKRQSLIKFLPNGLVLFFIDVRFEQEKKKVFLRFLSMMSQSDIAKNSSLAMTFARRGLFSKITAELDNLMDKFVTRITSSARSSSNAALCLPLSSRSTPNSSSTSATSIFFRFSKK